MPTSYSIDTRHGLAIIRLVGEVTGEDVDDVQRRYLTDARWEPTYKVLWDRRRLTRLDFGYPAFQMLADTTRLLAERLGPGRTAVVAGASRDSALTASYAAAAARMRARHPDREVRVFDTLPEAARWLDLPLGDLQAIADERDA